MEKKNKIKKLKTTPQNLYISIVICFLTFLCLLFLHFMENVAFNKANQ